MARLHDDPSRTWLSGLEHAVFDPRDWAVETLHDEMLRAASRSNDDRAAQYGELIAINQQFRLMLTYMKQWSPSPSVVAAFKTVHDLTRGMATALKLHVEDMDSYLLDVAIQAGHNWSLEIIVPGNRARLNQRSEVAGKPAGWPLTQAAREHRFDSLRHLIAHGARWNEQGKKVLTELPCDLDDHPAVNTPFRDRDLPWWAPLYNDERAWQVLVKDVVRDEFMAQHGENLALARERMEKSDAGWVLDMIVDWSLVTNRNAENFRDTGLDAVDRPDHRFPSRETLLAELFFSHVPMGPEAWAFLDEHALMPTPAEQEAIQVLRIRQNRPLSDLPDGWLPTVHQGKTLWALLDASTWDPVANRWNAMGQRAMAYAAELQALGEAQGQHPAERWLNVRLHTMESGHAYVASSVKEREEKIRSILRPVFDGLAQMEERFPASTIDRTLVHRRLQRWMERHLQSTPDKDPPRTAEERELRRVDLDAWLTTWADGGPSTGHAPRTRTRL